MWPGKAALQSMGVLFNMDEAATGFFKRGMLHVQLFALPPGTSQSDSDKFIDTIKNLYTGIKNAWSPHIVNSEDVKPIDLGGDLNSLANVQLTKEKRDDISIALGIPMSKLFSTDAKGLGGKGVVDADDRRMMSDTCLPEWMNIARELNRQVFLPMGLKLEEHHEKMAVFAENQGELATAFQAIVTAFNTNPELANILAPTAGIELDDDTQKLIDDLLAEKKTQAEAIQKQTNTAQQTEGNPVPGGTQQSNPNAQINNSDMPADKALDDLEKWQRKALKNIGKPFEFTSDSIGIIMHDTIQECLTVCKDADEIKALFAKYIKPAPVIDHTARAIDRALDWLEKHEKVVA
jgi:hypothetical protein